MEPGFRTGSILGDIVFGKSDGSAYQDQLGKNYQTQRAQHMRDKAMEEASRERSKNLARATVTPELLQRAQAGDPRALAEIGAGVLGSAETMNLRNFTGGADDILKSNYRQAAVERATLGDLTGANAQLFGVKNGPVEINKVVAGQQFNPYDDGGEVTMTPLGTATAELANARAAAQGALGRKYQAQADAGGFAPKVATVKTMTESEADTKEQWIVAQGNEMIVKGKSPEYVEAWIAKEMVKAGMEPEPTAVESLGQPKHVGRTKPAGIAPQGVDQGAYAKALQIKADAIRAIEKGAPKGKVAERLREKGYGKLADWINGAY